MPKIQLTDVVNQRGSAWRLQCSNLLSQLIEFLEQSVPLQFELTFGRSARQPDANVLSRRQRRRKMFGGSGALGFRDIQCVRTSLLLSDEMFSQDDRCRLDRTLLEFENVSHG